MELSTSWTRQEAARDKCPKRYYLAYLDPTQIGAAYLSLKSVRELGGHLIHSALARIVRRVADGGRLADEEGVAESTLTRFDEIVAACRHLPAGIRTGGLQIAELFNGMDPVEEIDYWRELIPIAIGNGIRSMYTLDFRSDASNRTTQAEKEIRYSRHAREHRGVIDVLIRDGKNHVVIDWKCHCISPTDLRQVEFYQDFLMKADQIPESRLFGFAVDLRREEIVRADFRPTSRRLNARLPSRPLISSAKNREPYPARPSLENCTRCAFASVCEHSELKPEMRNDEGSFNNVGQAMDLLNLRPRVIA